MQRRRPTSTGNWRIASRNGSDSMSPTVPPTSVITKSTSLDCAISAIRCLISSVMCGHHLDGAAEVVAAALATDHGVVDPARGDVGGARGVGVGEALVVAEVEIGLGAILGDEHLTVLVGGHRARVDVDVGVELLQPHGQPPRDQQPPDRRRGDALPQRGDHATGDEDEPGLGRRVGVAVGRGAAHVLLEESSPRPPGTSDAPPPERNRGRALAPCQRSAVRARSVLIRSRGLAQLARVAARRGGRARGRPASAPAR